MPTRRKGYSTNAFAMPIDREEHASPARVPDFRSCVFGSGHDAVPIWGKSYGPYRVCMSSQREEHVSFLHIPRSNCVIS